MRPIFLLSIVLSTVTAIAELREQLVGSVGADVGVVVLLDQPETDSSSVLALVKDTDFIVYMQSADSAQVRNCRRAGDAAGLLGTRLFVDHGSPDALQIANNLADAVWVGPTATFSETEVLRVLRPGGRCFAGDRPIVKPIPAGLDDWSHPYHGPDNNPQSTDQMARGELNTQFIAAPTFSPMPQQSVAAGGRIFKALGHIAHKANQNTHLNTLLCINAYNGVILWKRELPTGFMIHRNTMVATEDALYMGDHESCKVFAALTGELRDEITLPEELVDGPVWKWMAIQDGTLYALIGNKELEIGTQTATRRGLGHWPWGMWKGHDYSNPRLAFGFGRTLAALDLKTKKLRWHLKTEEFLDTRALCMNDSTLFAYAPDKALFALDRATGKELWKESGKELLDAIGPNQRAQHYITGYATSSYIKCSADYLFFAGPQRKQMAVASATSGKLAWTHPDGNLQIVLRPDSIYAAGPKSTGARLDYATGKILSELPTRRACTRATGTVDSVFYRARGGTIRVRTDGDEDRTEHIAAMRPPCQDGVLVANGHLYWGPWMCGCQLSLYGNIALGPAASNTQRSGERLQSDDSNASLQPLGQKINDWPHYRSDPARSDFRVAPLPPGYAREWTAHPVTGSMPTAPLAVGGMAFIGDRSGAVTALDPSGKTAWTFRTGGAIYYPPVIDNDRLFVGSGDGRVYALEAKTGRLLWQYQVAPNIERVNVFGTLLSRWPVAGGVVVKDDRVYAAAGIVNYDGTHVVALNAKTGALLAQNRDSGRLAPAVNGGISLQGPLSIVGDQLRFVGGGVYETARYDLQTLACRNEALNTISSSTQTAFYPYYPEYGKFVSLDVPCKSGTLCHGASYEGNAFSGLALQAPGAKTEATGEGARALMRRKGRLKPGKVLWQFPNDRRYTAFVASDTMLITAGHRDDQANKPFLAGIDTQSGSNLWELPLPADTVKGGLAIDHANRMFASLENGQILCFAPDKTIATALAEQAALPPPTETAITFLAEPSMKPYATGTKHGKFPVQDQADPLAPFSGQGIYFQQRERRDTELLYRIESKGPVREIHYRGAATFNTQIQILDSGGRLVLANAGPFNKGNEYSEHIIRVPERAGQRFILRFRNNASTWFYIEKLELK